MITDGPIEMFWRDFHVGWPVINIIPCQSTRVGPSKNRPREMKENAHHCLKKNADDHEWAQLFQWENLLMNLNGPIRMCEENCPWAQMGPFTSFRKLLIILNGPIQTHEENFRWAWMGPVCSMRETADEVDWAHSHAWTKPPDELEWAHSLPSENCQWLWMGPFLLMNKTADELEWAHSLPSENCRWLWMGPFLLMNKTADELEWAQYVQWEKLPMSLIGPIRMHEENCWWAQMGPVCSKRETIDELDWAHFHAWRKLPMSLNGPIQFLQKIADDFKWAHSYVWKKLPMSSNGPSMFNERNCWWAWLGPFCYVQGECSAWLELEGCDQDILLIDDGASALGTLSEHWGCGNMGDTWWRGHGRFPRRMRCSGGSVGSVQLILDWHKNSDLGSEASTVTA